MYITECILIDVFKYVYVLSYDADMLVFFVHVWEHMYIHRSTVCIESSRPVLVCVYMYVVFACVCIDTYVQICRHIWV